MTLKKLLLSFTLTTTLCVAAFAGETNSRPCAPGETSSPPAPCSSPLSDETTITGETSSPPVPESVDVISIAGIALWSLTQSLF